MMKRIFWSLIVVLAVFVSTWNLISKAHSATDWSFPLAPVSVDAPRSLPPPSPQPTPPVRQTSPTSASKPGQTNGPLPQKIDDETARSPVYPINSKHCTNHDSEGSEGDDFVRHCKAYGNYYLRASGFDYRVNYGIASADPKVAYDVMLFPLETGAASKYARADLYDQKLGQTIEWRLDAGGKPYAVIVRASFYKNTGSSKTFLNPKNKVAEFVLVRGLAGFEDLKEDLPTADTPYNPDEQARMIAAKFWESKQK